MDTTAPAGAPSARFPLLTRVLPVLGGLLLAAVLASLARRPFRSFDTYFHLRFGEEFRGAWTVSDPGQPSSASSAAWVPTQWLPQMGLAWVDDVAGTTGLVLLFAVLVTALLVALYLLLRTRTSVGAALVLAGLVLWALLPSLSLRPQVLSYLFVVAMLAAWDASRRTGRTPWWLIALGWLWAMCHGMWIVGVGASLVLAVGACLERAPQRREALRLLAVPVLMGVAACATPAGPRLVAAVFAVNSRAEFFHEWRAPELTSPMVVPVTLMLALAVVLLARRGPAAPFEVALALLGLGLAVYSTRTVPLAAIVLAFLLAGLVGRASPPRPGRAERAVVGALAIGVVVLAPALPLLDDPARELDPFAADLDALPGGTVVVSDREAGAVLLWTEPTLDVAFHGYGDVYTDAELEAYTDLAALVPGWRETLAGLGAEVALLPDDDPLAGALEDAGWRVVRAADDRVLLSAP